MNHIEELLLKRRLIKGSLFTDDNFEYIHYFTQSLKAHKLFLKDVDYVVQEGKVQIVDEFTGRILYGRRYSEGLHQAIEAKEHIKIAQRNRTLATITFQNYFRMYDKLSGMTGTADTEATEFAKIYNLDVVVIPTNRPVIRNDMHDIIYLTEDDKFNAICDEIAGLHKKGQPVLVGTVSIDKSEKLSRMLQSRGVRHEVLNAKNHAREALIIAEAGSKGAITIATNMAGRGTDIKLGEGVREVGGLAIIGTERHESRRIDRQLRGRAGRQGDPGSSIFFLSLEDDLMRLFGSERVARIMDRLGVEEGEVITHPMISRSIEKAQKKVETQNFAIRKRLLEYDDVMNQQREIIYDRRRVALFQEDIREEVEAILDEFIEHKLDLYAPLKSHPEEWDLESLEREVGNVLNISLFQVRENLDDYDYEKLHQYIRDQALRIYELKEQRIGRERMSVLERYFILRVIDEKWKDHLYDMDMLKEGIHLRAYGQKDPLIEYKREAFMMFEKLIHDINEETLHWLWKFQLVEEPVNRAEARRRQPQRMQLIHESADGLGFSSAPVGEETDIQKAGKQRSGKKQPIRVGEKIGPNDPCPCGSGKKYKKCHGAINN